MVLDCRCRIFLGSLFHRVGPPQANARRLRCIKFTLGTSKSNPPAERCERGGGGGVSAGVAVPRDTLACNRIVHEYQ